MAIRGDTASFVNEKATTETGVQVHVLKPGMSITI
jgi:hypothetical protein